MRDKPFRIPSEDLRPMAEGHGACIASDRIMVDGCEVGFLYRAPPDFEEDSGWRFLAGDESDAYMDETDKHGLYDVNTVANYDPEIIPHLESPIGAAFARAQPGGRFERVESPVDPDACLHPDYPIVEGHQALTSTWSLDLPRKFNRRVEDGALVLWRPGITVYLNALGIDEGASCEARISGFRNQASPDGREFTEHSDSGVQRVSYLLDDNGQPGLFGLVCSSGGDLQMTVYFDDSECLELARTIFASAAPA